MKKTILSMIITICLAISSFSIVFADDYDYFNSSYGTWSYYHISQSNNSTTPDYNEVGLSIGGLSFPIPNYTGAVSLVYQFNNSYSGTLTINYNSSVSTAYKLIYGDYGAKINYSSGSSINVSITDCTRLEIIVLGSNATKINSIDYSLTASAGNIQIDYSSQLSNIYQILTYLDSSVNNIESYTDNLEGYVDNIESYIDGLESTLSSISSKLTNIFNDFEFSNINTSNINSNVINIYNVLNSLYNSFTNSLSSVVNNTDSLETLLNTINNSINLLMGTVLDVNSVSVPVYSYSLYSMISNNNFSLVRNNSVFNYFIGSDIKNLVWQGRGTGYYIIYGSDYNNVLIDSYSSNSFTLVKIVSNANLYYYMYYVSGDNNLYSFDISFFDAHDAAMFIPLYYGPSTFIPYEVQSIMGIVPEYITLLNQLINSIDNLDLSVNVNPNVNVDLSNIGINFNNVNNYSYSLFSMMTQNNFTLVNHNGVFSYLKADDIKNINFTGAGDGVYIAYGTNYRNAYIDSLDNGSFTLIKDVYNQNFSWKLYYFEGYSSWWHWDISYLSNQSNCFIVPLYFGSTVNIPSDVLSIFGLHSEIYNLINSLNINNISNKLDSINDSINSLDLNFNVDITNQQINNITNDFETNMDIVNNVEVNFNTSFDSSNTSITDNDLTLDFTNLQPSITLYHDIFRSFYNIDLFKYVIIICMVGGVVLVLLG